MAYAGVLYGSPELVNSGIELGTVATELATPALEPDTVAHALALATPAAAKQLEKGISTGAKPISAATAVVNNFNNILKGTSETKPPSCSDRCHKRIICLIFCKLHKWNKKI